MEKGIFEVIRRARKDARVARRFNENLSLWWWCRLEDMQYRDTVGGDTRATIAGPRNPANFTRWNSVCNLGLSRTSYMYLYIILSWHIELEKGGRNITIGNYLAAEFKILNLWHGQGRRATFEIPVFKSAYYLSFLCSSRPSFLCCSFLLMELNKGPNQPRLTPSTPSLSPRAIIIISFRYLY